jgi:hypothetical protein
MKQKCLDRFAIESQEYQPKLVSMLPHVQTFVREPTQSGMSFREGAECLQLANRRPSTSIDAYAP